MLPRAVSTLIVVLLTLAELLNIFGQVFLGSGDTAFHVAYPAVLGALGLTTAKRPDPADEPGPGQDPAEEDTTTGDVELPPPTPLSTRHRRSR